jgi:hypothetical protein
LLSNFPSDRETPTAITSKSYAIDFAGKFGREFFRGFGDYRDAL